jgi:hypothetical protein
MVDKFRPLDYLPQGIYDARYWNIIAEDSFNLFSRLFVSGHTGKFPAAPTLLPKDTHKPFSRYPIKAAISLVIPSISLDRVYSW